ncbi:MAG: DUF2958 domain-containing protein [Evtepia sp.]
MYGYCHLCEWEWGYLMLSELENIRLPFGLTIERDLYVDDHASVGDLIE